MKRRSQSQKATRPAGRPKASNYRRKRQYLLKHGGWGFNYPEPKPWK